MSAVERIVGHVVIVHTHRRLCLTHIYLEVYIRMESHAVDRARAELEKICVKSVTFALVMGLCLPIAHACTL